MKVVALLIQDTRKLPSDLRTVAVSCQRNQWGGTHVGFLYDGADGSVWLCDVAWNLICRTEPVAQLDLCWLNIELRQEVLDLIATHLDMMPQNRAAIDYDVRFSDELEYFDPITWAYRRGAHGLTCATFIIAVLRGFELNLFDVPRWPSREEDSPAIEELIRRLEIDGVEGWRISAMRADHNNIRFRPEEVSAAVGEDGNTWPVPFPTAEALGKQLRTYVMSR